MTTKITAFVPCLLLLHLISGSARAGAVNVLLGTSDSFAVLAGTTVTNTGLSLINGDVGVSPGSAITGFPPGIVVAPGSLHKADAVALQAEADLTTAYNFAAGEPCGDVLTGQDLGGLNLTPGVYCFADSAQLTGVLTLNALGSADSVFIFQIASTLTTASNSAVAFIGGGNGDRVYWQIGSSATLGTATSFAGNILALSSITLNTGTNITCGSALARNGAVTLDTNRISSCGETPEPSTTWSMLLGFAALCALAKRCISSATLLPK